MSEQARQKVAINRQRKAMIKGIDLLFEAAIITKDQYNLFKVKIEAIHAKTRTEYRERFGISEKRSGRPKKKTESSGICKKNGCHLPAARGQVYCSREHAPCGYYSYPAGRPHRTVVKIAEVITVDFTVKPKKGFAS